MALILGVNYLSHDGCFSLVKDGELLATYEVERFNYTKHGREIKPAALTELLDDFGYTIEDIDYASFSYHPDYMEILKDLTRQVWVEKPWQGETNVQQIDWFYEAGLISLSKLLGEKTKVIPVRHHLAHIAGVYYPSGYSEAAVLSIDGHGESESIVIAHCTNADINIVRTNEFPNSLGLLYSGVTEWLGWHVGEEGKTMALAGYGEPIYVQKILSDYIELEEDGFFKCKNFPSVRSALISMFGEERHDDDELTQFHKDIAASLQFLTNDIFIRLAKYVRQIIPCKTLIITGGVALNSVANGKVINQNIFEKVLAFPHANDVGVSIGGALWIERNCVGNEDLNSYSNFTTPYLGKDIDLHNIPEVAELYGLTYQISQSPEKWAAKEIAQGNIVGWIQDRAELGPRALGNRSILANPQIANIKDIINKKIKNREVWRPFAPSVLAEDTSLYFSSDQLLPYMIIVADVHEEWKKRIPAVTHVDGTARVQSVEKNVNPKYHALLSELKQLTGIGMVLNTSFNDRGEPVVNTVEQAIRLFLRSQMDGLVIGNYIFKTKPEQTNDIGAFSGFNYTLRAIKGIKKAHIVYYDFGASLEHFKLFFDHAEKSFEEVTVDSGSASKEEIISIVGDIGALPENWKFSTTPLSGGHIFLIGQDYGAFWVLQRRVCKSEILDKALMLAHKYQCQIQGVDKHGGFSDLFFVEDVRNQILDKLRKS